MSQLLHNFQLLHSILIGVPFPVVYILFNGCNLCAEKEGFFRATDPLNVKLKFGRALHSADQRVATKILLVNVTMYM